MLLTSLILVLMMTSCSVSLSLLVSGYNRNLTKYNLTPNFEVAKEFHYPVDLNMSWLQIQPTVCTSCNEVYAIHEVGEYEGVRGGAMSRWEWEKDHLVRQEWVGTGVGPAHLLVDTDTSMAYSANYADGSWTAVRIENDESGNKSQGFNRTVFQEKFGKGCRNNTAHPHETVSLGDHVWVVDLGCDVIHHYQLDRESRVLTRMADITVGEGRGPRHMTLLPERGLAMVVCELENYIMLFKLDVKTGKLAKVQELNVVGVSKTAAAEILLHPNREWVYVSSRGLGLVAVFHLAPDKEELTKVQEFNIQGTWPRSMALSPAGDVLVVADQFSDSLQMLTVDPKDGKLSQKGQGVIKTPHQPSFVTFVRD